MPMCDFSVIRSLRKSRELTIAELCRKAQVAPAVLSRIERNQSSPELETLYRIAKAFGLTATDLLHLAESRTTHLTDEKDYHAGAFSFRRVDYGNIVCYIGTAPGGAQHSSAKAHADDYEICWVLEGAVQVTLPNESYRLERGRALQFDGVMDHRYEALSDSTLMIVHIKKEKRF